MTHQKILKAKCPTCQTLTVIYPQQMAFRVGAERSNRRSVYKIHDCGENREGNNPEGLSRALTRDSSVKGIDKSNPHRPFCSARCKLIDLGEWASESYKIPGKETINPEDLLKNDEDKE